MKIIKASYAIESCPSYEDALASFERAARTCYKSEDKITPGSAERLLKACITRGHESTIEHLSMSVRFIVDRGVSHELVRHRLAAFSQESTRYCNYGRGEVTFIHPCFGWTEGSTLQRDWEFAMGQAEHTYLRMLGAGASPQEARSVLPNSLKTEIVMTANFREWRHVFRLRTSKAAHPQMREVMIPLCEEMRRTHPAFFETVGPDA